MSKCVDGWIDLEMLFVLLQCLCVTFIHLLIQMTLYVYVIFRYTTVYLLVLKIDLLFIL